MIERHYEYTGSTVADRILQHWSEERAHFVKVMPTEYRLALLRIAEEREMEEENVSRSQPALTQGQVAA